jgi:hypothetical protein
LRGDAAVLVAGLAKQVDPPVVAQQLHVRGALVHHQAFERAPASKRDFGARRRRSVRRAQRAQKADEIGHLFDPRQVVIAAPD